MQKRKFFTLFFALAAMMLASTGQIRADQVAFTYFNQGNNVKSPVTVNCGAIYNDYALLRYGGKNLTISVSAGYSITSVRFVVARAVEREIISTTKGTLSTNRPQTDASFYVENVNSTSVTLSTTDGEYRIERIEVNYKVEEPMGSVDGLTGKNGSFRVWGWALDPDAEDSYAVTIHVYLFDNATETDLAKAKKGINAGTANISRPDLASIGHGTMHGFDFNVGITDLNPGTYYVRVFALDKQGISNPNLGYSDASGKVKSVTVSAPYTVSYNANGGSGAPGSQKKAQDVTLKLSTTAPTRTGYTFNGWNTNNSGTGTNYAAGANYTANANVTLYAKWTANKYTVTLNQQSGSGGSSSVQATYGSAMPSATMPTRAGYTFNGYFDAASGGTKYYNANGSSAKNWDKTAAANLYAQWSIVTYTISYDLKDGTVTGNPESYDVTTNAITLNNPTRTGYVFLGWTGSNGTTPQMTVTIAQGSTGNKSYTANWGPIYNITYDLAGGKGSNPATYSQLSETFQLAAPTRLGYNFLGWTGSNGETPQTVVEIAKGSTGDRNYTANWVINPSTTVAYKDSLDNTVAQETVAFNRPEAPEVAGFTFVTWEVKEGPLSEGITLQAIYTENEPSGAPKRQVGKFTLIRKGDKNEYILQTAK